MDHIKKIQFDNPWELIVIDNNSTDNTKEFVIKELENSALSFSVFECNIPGKMNAFWLGVNHAKYGYLLDCDDDNWLFSDYLQIGFEKLESNSKIGALGGKGIPFNTNGFPLWFEKYQMTYAVGPQGEKNGCIGDNGELYGAGTFFRKEILNKWSELGFSNFLTCRKGNELTSGGDTELCEVVKLFGFEIWYEESLHFYHEIEDRKLTEEYFLKLKKGIASSFPTLHAYKFQNHHSFKTLHQEIRQELFQYFKGLLLSTLIYALKKDFKNKIFRVTYGQLVKSYFKNLPETKRIFTELKEVF